MSSLDKALQILSCFSLERPELGVSEVAQELGMPKSSASRLMKAMAGAGLLDQEKGRRVYVPGIMAFQLGNIYQRHLKILNLVDEAVTDLVERFGLTGYIGVMNGTDVVLIAVRQGNYPIRMVLEKGTRVPAQVTAIGLALLSRRSDAEIRELFPEPVSYEQTNQVTSPEAILSSAARVREAGYATVEGFTFRGFNAIAAAVESISERQLIGFSLSYPQEFLARQDIEEIAQAMLATAHDVGLRTADPYWVTRRPSATGAIKRDAATGTFAGNGDGHGQLTTRLAGHP